MDTETTVTKTAATAPSKAHHFALGIAWEGNLGAGTAGYTRYGRRFRVVAEGKPDLLGSADPAFRGDAELHNPEELLLAAIGSCHLLTYLALCARAGVVVVGYEDRVEGALELRPGGGGAMRDITLRPRVTVAAGSDLALARDLHARAGELCFVASTLAVPVRHQVEVVVAPTGASAGASTAIDVGHPGADVAPAATTTPTRGPR